MNVFLPLICALLGLSKTIDSSPIIHNYSSNIQNDIEQSKDSAHSDLDLVFRIAGGVPLKKLSSTVRSLKKYLFLITIIISIFSHRLL